MDTLLAAVHSTLGDGAVLTGAAVTSRFTSWADPAPLQAKAVVLPRTTAEVAEILRLCHLAGQTVVTHGGRTNLVEGCRTTPADIVLSLERMDKVEAIDAAGHTLTVQAGVPLQSVQESAEAAEMFFPLDLAARGSATIGGCIAMNAGGVRVIRYGVMRELVLGLEAVLADGTVLSSLNKMLKNNAGYDLKQLFIGSEGTLGVVTRAVLRLFPGPRGAWTALVAADSFTQVTGLLNLVQRDLGGLLSSYEVMWAGYYRLTTTPPALSTPPLAQSHAFYVLLEILSGQPQQDRIQFEATLDRAQQADLFADAVVAVTAEQRAALWRVREDSEQLERQFHVTFGYDVSLPIDEMEEYVEEVRSGFERSFGTAARCFVYGHLGDGNLHINLWAPNLQFTDREEAAEIVYRPLRACSGSISAEHGIGLEKKAYLGWCRSEAEIEVMRRLKRALDPNGILNRGKVFD